MDAIDQLLAAVAAEQDDVLGTLELCEDDPTVADRLWSRLVDLLVEAMFLDLRRRHLHGAASPRDHADELHELAGRCRAVGLLPLGGSRAPS